MMSHALILYYCDAINIELISPEISYLLLMKSSGISFGSSLFIELELQAQKLTNPKNDHILRNDSIHTEKRQ